jgi:hypothetical protein
MRMPLIDGRLEISRCPRVVLRDGRAANVYIAERELRPQDSSSANCIASGSGCRAITSALSLCSARARNKALRRLSMRLGPPISQARV